VSELALDDRQRDAFACHLDSMRVASWCGANRQRTPAATDGRLSSARARFVTTLGRTSRRQ
jgi:hypothetical protein